MTGAASGAKEPEAASSPSFSPRLLPCKQKRKSCPFCPSCLNPPLPASGKTKAHPCAKGDTSRRQTATTPCTSNQNAHTTHATNQATRPALTLPREDDDNRRRRGPPPAKHDTAPCLAAPGPRTPFPPEPAPQPASGSRKTPARFPLRPKRTRHPPASRARQGRGGKLGH